MIPMARAPRLDADPYEVRCLVCDVFPGDPCRPVATYSPAHPTVRPTPHHVRLIDATRRT